MTTTKEYAKMIRKDLKDEFGKTAKFSVRTNYFSMGSEINIYIKSAKDEMFKGKYTKERIKIPYIIKMLLIFGMIFISIDFVFIFNFIKILSKI